MTTPQPAALPERFTKKPVTIEAVQFTEALRDAIVLDGAPCPEGVKRGATTWHQKDRKIWRADFFIDTLEGRMNVEVGDWIIKGVKGEFYPCKPDIFEMTYDRAALQSQPAAKCDGNHGGPRCADPECWNDSPAQPAAPGVTGAVQTLIEALKADPEYAWAWHCNVAMAAVDEGLSHYAANKAAARFLSWLAQIDTTTHPGFPKAPEQPAAAGVSDDVVTLCRWLADTPHQSNAINEKARAILDLRPQSEPVGEDLGKAFYELSCQPWSIPPDWSALNQRERDDLRNAASRFAAMLRQQAVPMTDEQIEPMFCARKAMPAEGEKDAWYWYAWGVNDGEAHHGITAQGAQGGEE